MRTFFSLSIVAISLLAGSSNLHGQDFLKQLEAKIFQKQQEAKNKEPKPDEELPEGGNAEPMAPPELLEPGEQPLPSDEGINPANEPMLLPAPSPEVPKKAPPSRTSKPTPAPPKPNYKPNASNPVRPSVTQAPSVAGNIPSNSPLGGGGFLGLTVEAPPGGGFGLTVVEIAPESPAWKAGFRTGDRVIGISGQAVSTVDAFAEELSKFTPGSPVKFLVERRGRNANLVAVLQDRVIAGQLQGARPGTAIDLTAPNPFAQGAGNNMPMANSRPARAYFGVNVSDMSDGFRRQFAIPAYRGASVTEVIPQSPAAAAGLKPGDCIVEIDGNAVQVAETVFDTIQRSKPGQVISVSYYRGRQLNTATVPLISDVEDPNSGGRPEITPEMLTPEYVASLHGELQRVHNELAETQSRLQQLEARLQNIEEKR
jgi:membrane-associated protease RseP (regulator of RpoE activity)